MDGGAVGAPVDLSTALSGKPREEISGWGVTQDVGGETLYLLDKTGCVSLIRLSDKLSTGTCAASFRKSAR